MLGWWLGALWLGLIAPASVPEARPLGGEVVVDRLDVLDESDDASYASGELKRGDQVAIIPGARAGWLAITPPPESFDWVDARAIQAGPDGQGEVVAVRAAVRSGCPDARLPGPPRSPLPKGAPVRLLDRPPLTTGQGDKARTWRAIAPPPGEVRFVRSEGVRLDELTGPAPEVERRAAFQEPTPPRRPDPPVPSSPDEAIRSFDEALRRSRRLDAEVAQIKQRLADARTGTERAYDARGMLQASSRQVEGQKVHALIGPQGVPIAYLAIPPGIPTSRLLSRKVGVRGDVHYNEILGARLITVRDLDAIDRPR